MAKLKLPDPILFASEASRGMWRSSDDNGHPFHIITKGKKVRSHAIPLYTHDQLIQALTDFGGAIAERMSMPRNNYGPVVKFYVKELLP